MVIAAGQEAERTYCEPGIVDVAQGQLLCLHRTEKHKVGPGCTFWSNTSFDGGRTWDAPEDTGILSGACPRLLKVGWPDTADLWTTARTIRYSPPLGLPQNGGCIGIPGGTILSSSVWMQGSQYTIL